MCWGAGEGAQLGTGATLSTNTPVAVRQVHDAVDIVAGLSTSCARDGMDRAWCWGVKIQGADRVSPFSRRPSLIVAE